MEVFHATVGPVFGLSFWVYITTYDVLVGATALIAAQLFSALLFSLKMRREFSVPSGPYSPPLTVLIPCKGDLDGLRENALSVLDQRYEGPVEFIFVTPSEGDPAHSKLGAVLKERPQAAAKLLASGAVPTRSSGKITDLLFALKSVSERSEVLLFADADIRVSPDWAKEMVAPLGDPGTGLTTTSLLYVPEKAGFWGLLRLVWMGCVVVYSSLMDCVVGQSMAIRRRDFEALKVPEVWDGVLMEDLALAARARQWEKRIRFVGRAMPVCGESVTFRRFFGVFDKWVLVFRLYDLRFWLLGAGLLAAKLGVLTWAIHWRLPCLLAYFLGGEMLNALIVFGTYRRHLAERFSGIHPGYRRYVALAALTAPLVTLVYAMNYFKGTFGREVRWGGYRYKVRGKKRLEVHPV